MVDGGAQQTLYHVNNQATLSRDPLEENQTMPFEESQKMSTNNETLMIQLKALCDYYPFKGALWQNENGYPANINEIYECSHF